MSAEAGRLVLAEQTGVNRLRQAAILVRRGRPSWSGPNPNRGGHIDEVIERTWWLTGRGPISVRTAEKAPDPTVPRRGGPLGYWVACLEACKPVLERLVEVLRGLDLGEVVVPHVVSGPLDARQRGRGCQGRVGGVASALTAGAAIGGPSGTQAYLGSIGVMAPSRSSRAAAASRQRSSR